MKTLGRMILITITVLLFPYIQTTEGRTPEKQKTYQTTGTYPFCTSKNDLLLTIQLKEQDDSAAIAKLMDANRCYILQPKLQVFPLDIDKRNNFVKIRIKGFLSGVWTVREAVSEETPKEAMAREEIEKLSKITEEIETYVNAILETQTTTCVPARSEDNASYSLLLASSLEVFSIPVRKKAWLLICTGSAGNVLNENPKTKIDIIALTDSKMVENSKAFVISADLVKHLQGQVKTGKMTLDAMYEQLINKGTIRVYTPTNQN